MKKLIVFYKCTVLSLLFILLFFNSCKKDGGLDSRELLVYVQGEYGALNNMVSASLIHTPVSVWGNTVFSIPVHATREVPADVTVHLAGDERYVNEFNAINNTTAIMLPAANYKFNSSQHSITAGTAFTESLQVEILNPSVLTDSNGYVLPVTITRVESQDKGVRISSNRATAYLYIPYNYTNIDSTEVPLSGTNMTRTGWSVTVSNTTSGALGPAMLDGNNSTAWRSSNSASAAKWVVLNMGSMKTVKGFKITPNYVSTNENATQMTISTSADNVNWTEHGIWNGTRPAVGSNATNPDIKGVNFISPVEARYFRFVINSWVAGSRVGIAELNAVE